MNQPTDKAQYEICGHVLYPGGNEWICVLEEGHADKHNHWPNELVSAGSSSWTLGEQR